MIHSTFHAAQRAGGRVVFHRSSGQSLRRWYSHTIIRTGRAFVSPTPPRRVPPLASASSFAPSTPAMDGLYSTVRVNTTSNEYLQNKREARGLSTAEFQERLHSFSRLHFNPEHTPAAHALLADLLEHRVAQLSNRSIREYMHLAHAAGLHDLCLTIFHKRAIADEKEMMLGITDFVVDSAYKMRSVPDLLQLANFCVVKMERYSTEIAADFGLCRILWRCVCLASCSTTAGERAASLDAACRVVDEHIRKVNEGACEDIATEKVLHRVEHIVRYASHGDEGEMLFVRYCVDNGLLRSSTQTFSLQSDDASFFASLIWSCRAGNYTDAAIVYFEQFRQRIGLRSANDGGLLIQPLKQKKVSRVSAAAQGDAERAAAPGSTADKKAESAGSQEDESGPLQSSAGDAPDATVEDALEAGMRNSFDGEGLPEFLTWRLLTVLQRGKANDKIVDVARLITRDSENISIGLWTVMLIAAGEAKAADVAIRAFHYARDQVSNPSVDNKRGFEYLLQTALNSLSKCSVHRFEEDYLLPTQESKLTHCTDDYYICLLLQDALNSPDPMDRLKSAETLLRRKNVEMSLRIASLVLKVHLRVESPELLSVYQHFTRDLHLFKNNWLDDLLLWADKRRYELTQEQRSFILDEVARERKQLKNDVTSGSGSGSLDAHDGIRAHYAFLRHDYEHQPCRAFLKEGIITPEPSVGDPRVYFVFRRSYCIAQDTVPNSRMSDSSIIGVPLAVKEAIKRQRMQSVLNEQRNGGNNQSTNFRLYGVEVLRGLQQPPTQLMI